MSTPLVVIVIASVLVLAIAFRWARRRQKPVPCPAREHTAFVLLQNNTWETCAVDDVHEPWARLATEPVRGFCGVGLGRHRVNTVLPAGEARVDFVVYPGERLAYRLDPEQARWELGCLDASTLAILNALSKGETPPGSSSRVPGWLVHLRTTIDFARARTLLTPRKTQAPGIERVRARFARLVANAEWDATRSNHAVGSRLVAARALGETLIGISLTYSQLCGLVAPCRTMARRLSSRGDTKGALAVLGLGLALLPSDPQLTATAGCILALAGSDPDAACRALDAALERSSCLLPEDLSQATRLRADLRAQRLHPVRV